MSENKLHDAILAATKARRAVMSENINPESVRALLEGTTPGPWEIRADDHGYSSIHASEEQGDDLIAHLFGEDADGQLATAAPSIARAYLALSERLKNLEHENAELREAIGRSAPM